MFTGAHQGALRAALLLSKGNGTLQGDTLMYVTWRRRVVAGRPTMVTAARAAAVTRPRPHRGAPHRYLAPHEGGCETAQLGGQPANVVLCSGFADDQHALAMRQHRVDVARLRETVGELLAPNPLVESVGESHVP